MAEKALVYKGRTQWSVLFWLTNDKELSEMCLERVAHGRSQWHSQTQKKMAEDILWTLHNDGKKTTPDGCKYSVTNIMAAIRKMYDWS